MVVSEQDFTEVSGSERMLVEVCGGQPNSCLTS